MASRDGRLAVTKLSQVRYVQVILGSRLQHENDLTSGLLDIS